ncbi:hypothetical protein BCV69DRAFT_283552 [Microstroma glucosiphilum]|uniref:Uncharacterized protein n=1 Tax=Pseudomicrostroma glucosiphilum TaxID=1684307 RepID=A0A316U426_9BASI|nr:hypothetical protein BCV69DRAFT_283552 [Pseudomicrostroma glucosiphilum]PWN20029.1 hypothetical protein BCV69DRAFT_283552 [Pseudomicrostroma glucosiphilum]
MSPLLALVPDIFLIHSPHTSLHSTTPTPTPTSHILRTFTMLANIGTLVLAFSAAAATVGAASIEERANNRPHNANEYFNNSHIKLAEYIYFGPHGKFAGPTPESFVSTLPSSTSRASSIDLSESSLLLHFSSALTGMSRLRPSSMTDPGSRPISFVSPELISVYATEYKGDGHPLSQTGPVGYSMKDIDFVTVKTGPSYKAGGTCETIIDAKGWCRNKFVPNYGVDLSTVDADGNDVDTTDSADSDE